MSTSTRRGFTLIELLVVIAIIALLIGILVPALGSARKSAREAVCLVQFRQYGLGSEFYAQEYKEFIPAEGLSDGSTAGDPIGPWDDGSFWANAIPQILGDQGPAYYDLQESALAGGTLLPGAGTKSIFVCPEGMPAAAGQTPVEVDGNGHFMMWGLQPGATSLAAPRQQRPVYWSYIYNAGLDNISAGPADAFGTRHLKLAQFQFPGMVVQMVETMMTPNEASPLFTSRLNRAKTKGNPWQTCRLSGRHRAGGNLLYLDGHVGFITRKDATTDWANDGTFNRSGRWLWQP